jgi:hypothetical protein
LMTIDDLLADPPGHQSRGIAADVPERSGVKPWSG